MNARSITPVRYFTFASVAVAASMILATMTGCTPNAQDYVTTNSPSPSNPGTTSAAPPTPATGPQTTPPPSDPAPSAPETPTAPAASNAPPGNLVRAEAGVGAKGRSLDQHEGLIVTPAKTLFAARERTVFDILIPQAMQLYKATNGQAPANHDEFMQKIVAENNIQLPQLPQGHQYVYDPQTEQLMVRK